MNRRLIAAVGTAAVLVSVAACSSSSTSSTGSSSPSSYAGKTLTVWFMSGSNTPKWTAQVQADFEKAYPGAKLNIQVQQWNGIGQKVTTALSENTPPDVLEMGNTQTAGYAATGGLMDLTSVKSELGGDKWAPNLNNSAVFNGKQYAAPWYFTNRVVIYNKKLWTAAGLTSAPQTLTDFYADLTKLNATKGVSQALYMPGEEWYTYFGMLLGQGGKIAVQQNGKWVGNLESPEAKAAMAVYAKLQGFSKAPKDKDEATPQQSTVFSKGDVGAEIGLSWEAPAPTAIPADQIGYFPLPSDTAGKPMPVFLGGSNLAIAQNSQNKDLAVGFLKIALDDKNEGEFASEAGIVPNNPALNSLANTPFAQAALPAAGQGDTTPNLPQWAAVENTPNPIKQFMTDVLEGKDYATAAKTADDEITKRLNAQQ
ncbi:extracellular solute-binding protein [Streptacidiphilus jiangxiensis]|uniref:N,N'-diacetylchitobiose transport system substrate-binding protein n=1 Tax=Streptacidiphilus jiangxiensis TaxID=235985 RepID=A0A1H7G1Y5_STRJI|nr:extracellular solute-binding protein [Streptacidiphilus jiangxiensis]SEK31537.1 N,N'-diacetylchitobiose transport system substrate-binding protein [Streptacidiphilus jiangxiensis]